MKIAPGVPILLMVKRYIRFGIVGASGIAVDMALLFVISDPKMLGINLSVGKVIAAEIALISNFIWNEIWTFGDISAAQSHWRCRLRRLIRFNLICAAGIGLSILLLNLQVRFIAMNVYVDNLIAILIVSLWNFGMNLKFGWNKGVAPVVLKKRDAGIMYALEKDELEPD